MNTDIRGCSCQCTWRRNSLICFPIWNKITKPLNSIIDVFPKVLSVKVHAILSNTFIFPSLVHQNFCNSVRHQEDSLHNSLSNINNKLRVWRDASDHPWIIDSLSRSHIACLIQFTNCFTQAFLPREEKREILPRWSGLPWPFYWSTWNPVWQDLEECCSTSFGFFEGSFLLFELLKKKEKVETWDCLLAWNRPSLSQMAEVG